MTASPSTAPGTATEGLTIGRAALRQLHAGLLRDAGEHAITILQDAGFAAGAGLYQAFSAWLPAHAGVARPEDLDADHLAGVLTEFFQATGWGSVTVGPLGPAALALDTTDWAEAEPGTAQSVMCFFSSGMLADFLGRLSGEPVAVMEVECRSRNDARCRFLSASPETLNAVYEQMQEGRSYEEALGG
jgi:predicted hydrocarbon binding protein